MRGVIFFGLLVALLGVVGLIATCGTASSIESYLNGAYGKPASKRLASGGVSKVYHSKDSVLRTAEKIASGYKPGDRKASASGVFLRYSRHIVGVLPSKRGGSDIYLDDERTGYGHFYGYVGGTWGTYSGRGESFRGGGPGSGK